jgi:hypothetical protein
MYNIIISRNDTSRISLVSKVEIISTPVVVVVVEEVEVDSLCRSCSSGCSGWFATR